MVGGATLTLSSYTDAGISLEIAGHDYTRDKLAIKMALSHVESLIGVYNGYTIGPPSERFGWTFFTLFIRPDFQIGIESKFADMLAKYAKEHDRLKRFSMFVSDYLESRGCVVKVKAILPF